MSAPLDVVVVSYNRRSLLLGCCASVAAGAPDARLIVVDNASSDDSAAAVRDRFPAAVVIEAGSNLGFARAVNRGARAGTAARLLLLNSDARLESGALPALRAALDGAPDVAAVGPRLRGANGALELSTGRTMRLLNEAWFKILGAGHRDGGGPATRWLERQYARPRAVISLTGACLLLRRAAFEQVGGMDERFFLYAEDVDLCVRLAAAGWRLRYTPAAAVRHARGASAGLDPHATERIYRASQLMFYRKHAGAWSVAALRGYLAARYLTATVLRRGAARAHARELLRWCLDPD